MTTLKEMIEKKFEFNAKATKQAAKDDIEVIDDVDFTIGARWQHNQLTQDLLPILLECVEALNKCANKTIWNNNSLEQDFFETNEIALKALERLRKWSEG